MADITNVWTSGGICLDDLEKLPVTVSRNGKRYVNLVFRSKREIDKFNNTHELIHQEGKGEEKRITTIGSFKEWSRDNGSSVATTSGAVATSTPPPAPVGNKPAAAKNETSVDDLPF